MAYSWRWVRPSEFSQVLTSCEEEAHARKEEGVALDGLVMCGEIRGKEERRAG